MAAIHPINNELVHLAASITEANDSLIPSLLLHLRPILNSEPTLSKKHSQLLREVWKYELPQMLLTALRQDLSLIPGSCATVCQLCEILAICCHGYEILKEEGGLLRRILSAILVTLSKVLGEHKTADKMYQTSLCRDVSVIVTSLTMLSEDYPLSAIHICHSKHFMQLLMFEDSDVTMVALALLKNLLRANRGTFDHLPQYRVHGVADELAFKIISTGNKNVSRLTVRLFAFIIEAHRPLLKLLSTKRYQGFTKHLLHWRGQGFDADVLKLVKLLDSYNLKEKSEQKRELEAIRIQSVFRGYVARKQLRHAHSAISLMKAHFKEKSRARTELKERSLFERRREKSMNAERRGAFLKSKKKTLQVVEGINASTVERFFNNVQNEAARKIQAAWRGYKARKRMWSDAPQLKQYKAAVTIQRQIKRWLAITRERRRTALTDLLPPGLTDYQRVNLQSVIANIREKFPLNDVSDSKLREIHERGFRLLNNHIVGLRKSRHRDEHRRALLAQLHVQNELLSSIPTLKRAQTKHIEEYSSKSMPVVMAARRAHLDLIRAINEPWWKKSSCGQDEDAVLQIKTADYLLDEDKIF